MNATMKNEKVELLVTACSFKECYKIYRPFQEQWVDIGPELYEEIQENYQVSHGFCPEHLLAQYRTCPMYKNITMSELEKMLRDRRNEMQGKK